MEKHHILMTYSHNQHSTFFYLQLPLIQLLFPSCLPEIQVDFFSRSHNLCFGCSPVSPPLFCRPSFPFSGTSDELQKKKKKHRWTPTVHLPRLREIAITGTTFFFFFSPRTHAKQTYSEKQKKVLFATF